MTDLWLTEYDTGPTQKQHWVKCYHAVLTLNMLVNIYPFMTQHMADFDNDYRLAHTRNEEPI